VAVVPRVGVVGRVVPRVGVEPRVWASAAVAEMSIKPRAAAGTNRRREKRDFM
jgi:hypothetical protein